MPRTGAKKTTGTKAGKGKKAAPAAPAVENRLTRRLAELASGDSLDVSNLTAEGTGSRLIKAGTRVSGTTHPIPDYPRLFSRRREGVINAATLLEPSNVNSIVERYEREIAAKIAACPPSTGRAASPVRA